MKLPLLHIAHARSGDKGDTSNIGVIVYDPRHYPFLLAQLTPDRVQQHFGDLVHGPVTRYELPNIHAVNFVMERALDGGGTVSTRIDAQGKTLSAALLRMEIDIPE